MSGLPLPSAIGALNRANKVLRSKAPLSRNSGAQEELPRGERDGVSWQIKPGGASRLDRRAKHAQQHEVAGQQLDVTERRPSTDAVDSILSPDELHQLAATIPNYRPLLMGVTRRILRGERHHEELPEGTDGAKLELAAYALALHCLNPEGDAKAQQGRMTALLTPIKPATHDPQALATLFQRAVDPDAEEQEELINLLIELKSAGARIEDPRSTAARLCKPGRDESDAIIDDTDALMAWLRGVLNLPTISDRAYRRETVLNDLANFRASSRGAIVAKLAEQQAKSGVTATPAQGSEPSASQDHDPDFLDRLSGLLSNYSFAELQSALNNDKRRAGDKLPQNLVGAEAPAVRDAQLGATLKELGDLHVASTLVMFVKNTLDFFRRTGRGALDGTRLMQELLGCLQAQPPEARHYQQLLDSLGVKELVPQIVLLTNLKNVVQNLPTRCFANNEARVKAVGAIQAALDPHVNAEDDSAAPLTTNEAEAR